MVCIMLPNKFLLILDVVGCSLDVFRIDGIETDLDFGVPQARHEEMLMAKLTDEYQLDETLFDCLAEMVDGT